MSQEAKVIGIISVVTIAILFGGIFLLGKQGATTPPTTQKADTKNLIKPNSHATEAKNKKVTIVEFGDYQCPACGAYYPTVKQLVDAHKDSVQLVFRNFPLSQHPNAIPAALSAEAAGRQNKYWEMHDLLYQNQNEWSDLSDPKATFIEYAKKINLNADEFTKDYDDKTGQTIIDQDQSDGITLGVDSTPTFYVNGEKVDNNPDLKSVVEKDLK